MIIATFVYAIILILLGAIGWFGSDGASVTALIPVFFAVPVAICGFVALKPSLRMHAMHGAVLVGLIALLGAGFMGFRGMNALVAGTSERPMATVVQLAMAAASAIYIVLCVRSFIKARLKK